MAGSKRQIGSLKISGRFSTVERSPQFEKYRPKRASLFSQLTGFRDAAANSGERRVNDFEQTSSDDIGESMSTYFYVFKINVNLLSQIKIKYWKLN